MSNKNQQNQQCQQEAFTALLDNELSPNQIDSLSYAVTEDKEFRQQIARHQLINSCIRAEHIHLPVLGLVDSVSQRLQDEPTVLAPTRWHRSRWIQPLVGTAVAASVAALGIVFAPQLLQQDDLSPVAGMQVVAQPVTVSPAQEPTEQKWNMLPTNPANGMDSYLQNHSEYAAQGVMPYASYVSYGSSKR